MNDLIPDIAADPFARLPSLPADDFATHEVMNQATPLAGHNAFTGDRCSRRSPRARTSDGRDALLADAGATVASARVAELARDANRHTPELRSHDRFGHRIDEIAFHPAWHELMSLAIGHGTHALAWTAARPGAHVARGLLSYLWNQGESGICCPLGMTYSAVPALRLQPDLAALWEPFILSTRYDATAAPMHGKTGGTVGMTLTEKQAGSDLRATQTTARPAGPRRGPGEAYLIDGHKWFFSVPHSDLFVTLAHSDRGLSLLPAAGMAARRHAQSPADPAPQGQVRQQVERLERDRVSRRARLAGRRGGTGHQGGAGHDPPDAARLRHRLGRADAPGAVRGDPPRDRRGAPSSGRLVDQPLMQNVVADLALEVEAATLLAFRLARAVDDEQAGDAEARHCWCASARRSASTGTASASSASCTRRWNATAATASSRKARWPGSTARRRSTASGRAAATSSPSTCCAPPAARRRACRPSSTRCAGRRAATGASTA